MRLSLWVSAMFAVALTGAISAHASSTTPPSSGQGSAAPAQASRAPAPATVVANPFTMESPTAEQLAREEELRRLAASTAQAAGASPASSAQPSRPVRRTARTRPPSRTAASVAKDLSDWGLSSAAHARTPAECDCREFAKEDLDSPRLVAVYSFEGRLHAVVEMHGSRVPLAHGSVSPWGQVHIDEQGRAHFGTTP